MTRITAREFPRLRSLSRVAVRTAARASLHSLRRVMRVVLTHEFLGMLVELSLAAG